MSLGAIDFGLIVDGAVIIVENAVHRITRIKERHAGMELTSRQMDTEVLNSAKRMMNSATFGQIIILIVYLPILALVGIEGKMFRPMAQTVSFAILGALILSLTYVPIASALFLSKKKELKNNISEKIMSGINKVFTPLLNFSLKHKLTVVIISLMLLLSGFWIFTSLGGEFIPQLEEGDLASGVMTLQGGSLSNTIETVEKANKILMTKFPEVKHTVCKIGTGEIPTDPTPMETGDYIIVMKDKSEWTSAETREEMIEKMQEELSVLKGVVFTLQQPIQMRFNELMTGSKQDVAVKIFGDNLEILAQKAEEIEKIVRTVPGVEEVNVEQVTGSGQIQVIYNRKKIAQYGVNISDINNLLETAFAGNCAGVVYDEEKRFDLVVRFNKDYRQDIENIKGLYVPLPNGGQIPLDQLASVEIKTGTAQVSRESTKRRITVSFNVRNRDVESIIDEVHSKIDKSVKRSAGYYITYGGQFENLVAAKKRLSVAVPVALLLIFVLLFFTFHSIKQTFLIYSAVPMSAIGGVIALYLRDMNFSISAGIGFIALFGVAVLNGIVLIAEFNRLEKEEGITDIYERVRKGIKSRLRPVIMTATVASLGFLPMAISTSAGAEVQKPLATVVIGGLISATLLTLIILPVLYILFSGKRKLQINPVFKSILLIISLFVVVIPNSSYAQTGKPKTYTLDQAVTQALANNGNIKSASLQIEYQKKLKNASWEFRKTDVEYMYGQTNSMVNDNNLTISQSFPGLGLNIGQSKLAEAYVKNSEIEFIITQAEIVNNVKSSYFNLAYYLSLLKQLQYQDSIYTDFYKATGLRADKGESPLLEKIAAQTQLMKVKTLIAQANADIMICKTKLQVLLNEKEDIKIADTLLQKAGFSFVIDSNAIAGNPALELLQHQTKISSIETKVERLKLMPEYSVAYFNQSNKDIKSGYRFTGGQVGVSVPLLFFSQSAKIKASKINQQIAQNNYEYYKSVIYGELQSLLQEYLKYKTSLEFYEKTALPQAELIIEQSGKSYKTGNIDYVEYVLNLNETMEIKTNYLQTLNDYNQSVIAIEKAIGRIN